MDPSTHYAHFAAAYARGKLALDAATPDAIAIEAAEAAGLRLHRYKRNAELPRVRRVLGILHGLAPETLLDVGSGRGTFLLPLLDAFLDLPVTALDLRADRVEELACMQRGGLERMTAVRADITARLPFDDDAFDAVTVLEVLEHLDVPERAAKELSRVARRHVILSVPSKPDDNPEHLHLLAPARIEAMFTDSGARSVRLDYVLNHLVGVVSF